ncbi:MAG: hypothetical protein AAGH79_05550 [Bacteroidota bacterium]
MENDTEVKELWKGHPHPAVNFWVFVSCLLLVTAPYALYCYVKTKRTIYRLNTEWLMVQDPQFAAVKVGEIKEINVHKPRIYGWLGLADLLVRTEYDTIYLRGLLAFDEAKRTIEKHQKQLQAQD